MANDVVIAIRAEDHASTVIAGVDAKIKSFAGGAEQSTTQASSGFKNLTSSISAISPVAIGAAGGFALLSAGVKSVIGTAAEFQQQLANVRASTGATTEQMARMRAEALKIGADTSKSASEAVQAFGELTRAGVSVEDAVGGVARTVVQLAEATGAGVAEMASLLSNSLNTFGLAASEASTTADTIAQSTAASAISVNDFAQSLQAVGPVAKLAGLDMQDMSAAIGILGNNALKGSDAGTSLKTMLTSLAAPSKDAAAEMKRLGISLYDANGAVIPFRDVLAQLQSALGNATDAQKAQSLQTIFGSDAIRASTILLKEGVEGWDEFLNTMADAPTVAEQSEARLATLSGQVEQLKGSLETMSIQIGTEAIPALTALATAATTAVSVMADGPGPISGFFKAAASGIPGLREVQFLMSATGEEAKKLTASMKPMFSPQMQDDLDRMKGGLTELAGEMQKAPAPAQAFAGALAAVAKAAKEGKSEIEAMGKAIDDVASQGTAAEQVWSRQGKALEAVASNAKAMSKELDPKAIQDWGFAARDAAQHAGLSATEMGKLDKELALVAKGGPAVSGALERIDAILKPHKESVAAMGTAYRDTAALTADLAKEELGLGGSMASLKQSVTDMTATFIASMGRIPANIAQVSAEVRASIYAMLPTDLSAKAMLMGMGFSEGLAAGILARGGAAAAAAGEVAGAAVATANRVLQTQSPSKLMRMIGQFFSQGLEEGIEAGAPGVIDAVDGMVTAAVNAVRPLEANTAAVARLALHIGQLEDQLKHAEPFSAHAEAIQKQIEFYNAWKGQIESVISVQALEKAALEANTSALERFNQERGKADAAAGLTSRVGSGAAGAISAVGRAVETGDRGDISSALKSWDDFITTLRERGVKDWQSLGEQGRDIIAAALAATTPEQAAAALSGLTTLTEPLQQQVTEAATLSGRTFSEAFEAAVLDDAMAERLGSKGAAAMRALTAATEEGSPDTIAAFARANADILSELERLPDFIEGPLVERMRAAALAVASAPNDPEVRAQYDAAVQAATTTLALIPEAWEKLPSQVQAAMLRLATAVDEGLLPVDEAVKRGAGIADLIGDGFEKLPARVQGALALLAVEVEAGTLTSAEAAKRGAAIADIIGTDFERQPPRVQAALSQLAANVQDGMMSAADATSRSTEIMRFALRGLESEYPEVQAAAQSYIDALVAGEPINYRFADSMKAIEEQAKLTAKGIADSAAAARAMGIAAAGPSHPLYGKTPPPGGMDMGGGGRGSADGGNAGGPGTIYTGNPATGGFEVLDKDINPHLADAINALAEGDRLAAAGGSAGRGQNVAVNIQDAIRGAARFGHQGGGGMFGFGGIGGGGMLGANPQAEAMLRALQVAQERGEDTTDLLKLIENHLRGMRNSTLPIEVRVYLDGKEIASEVNLQLGRGAEAQLAGGF